MSESCIVVGDAILGSKIASELNCRFIKVDNRVFPDGEIAPRILVESVDDIKSKSVVAVFQKGGEEPVNNYVLRSFLTLSTLKRYGADRLIEVFPYFAYARQDNEFRIGEPVSCGIVAKIFEDAGATDFITITSHVHRITGIDKWFPNIKAYDISGVAPLAEFVKNKAQSPEEFVVFAPDGEGIGWATEMASIIGSDTASALEKERNVNTGEIKQKLVNEVDVRGRNILIVDDIVSTGKTIAQAANMLKKEKGAKKVAFAYVHPVHSPGAVELMRKTSPIFIATTDTIDNSAKGIEVVSVAGAVAKKIKEIL
ncbi:MAG: ribose-phosphate diphosphokinase [Promethearchaeati archaeon SRVP18_Atabeyarchaeia-1]